MKKSELKDIIRECVIEELTSTQKLDGELSKLYKLATKIRGMLDKGPQGSSSVPRLITAIDNLLKEI